MKFAHGYDATYRQNLDGLGILYLTIVTLWTAILLAGILFLYVNRHLPFIRIRNVPLAISAVLILHIYWILCFLAYVLQAAFSCSTEFWIMSIYLPLGVALFNACNSQLLHVAGLQKKIVTDEEVSVVRSTDSQRGQSWRWSRVLSTKKDRVRRVLVYVAYGLMVQLVVTLLIYLISRKFHPSFGLIGERFNASSTARENDPICANYRSIYGIDDCDAAYRLQCRRGWEWVPSIVWQLFWAWVYAPYLLWQVRGIRDNHGWRMQTVCCCLAGMVSSPMWLLALYAPKMSPVNKYFIAPMWFTGPILLIEAFLIFVPCRQIIKNRRLRLETLDIIAEWEYKNTGTSLDGSTQAGSRFSTQACSLKRTGSKRSELYTMAALDSCIRTNFHPLLLFAALKDFSGENIAFLTKVLEWRRGWTLSNSARGNGFLRKPTEHEVNNNDLRRQQYRSAVNIYASFISLKYSEFPVNLSSVHLRELESVFGNAAFVSYGKLGLAKSEATPFDVKQDSITAAVFDMESRTGSDSVTIVSDGEAGAEPSMDNALTGVSARGQEVLLRGYESVGPRETLPEYVPIPVKFGPDVFRDAEESVKYTVLTNTWPKFVNAGYARQERKAWMDVIKQRFGQRES